MLERCVGCRFLRDSICVIYKSPEPIQCDLTNIYDKSLQNIAHYKVHPEMMPFVGINYGQKNKRILLVAESHYVENMSLSNLKNWYSTRAADSYVWYVSTAQIRAEVISGKVKSTTIDNNLASAINKSLEQININLAENKQAFTYIAYMNFFQRPSETPKSISNTAEDNQIANDTFEEVVKILKPDHVLLISKKAWDTLCNKTGKDFDINRICHPSSSWWNRKAYITPTSVEKLQVETCLFTFLLKASKLLKKRVPVSGTRPWYK